MKTVYTALLELNELQTSIMKYIDNWTHEQKTTVPLKEIVNEMNNRGIKYDTTVKSVRILLKKGYIRRSEVISNKTSFVQLRSI